MMRGNPGILGLICTLSLCLGAAPALAQAPSDAPTIIGQIVYQKSGLQEAEKKNLQGYFSYKLRSVAGTHRILNAGFFQKNASFTRCDNGPCMSAMGKQLNANQVIQTRLTRRGKKCVVQCTVFNVDKKKSERTVEEVGDCSQENLFILVENAVIRVARFNSAAFATERGTEFPDDMDDEGEEEMPLADEKDAAPVVKKPKVDVKALSTAVKLYRAKKYRQAMKWARVVLAHHPSHLGALSIVAEGACNTKNGKAAAAAITMMPSASAQTYLKLCARKGIKLKAKVLKRKPAKK